MVKFKVILCRTARSVPSVFTEQLNVKNIFRQQISVTNALLITVLSTFYDVYFHRMQHQKLT